MSDSSDAVTTLLVNIDVSDLGQAIEFYTTGLGLTVRQRPYPNIVELQGGSSPVFLTEHPAGTLPCPEASRPREYCRHWTPVHLDFVDVSAIDAREGDIVGGVMLVRIDPDAVELRLGDEQRRVELGR